MDMPTSAYCRCCASEAGATRDLVTKYQWMKEEEVYSNMLKDCFSIDMQIYKEGSNGICDKCVLLLRSSFSFKKQVLASEEKLCRQINTVPVPKMYLSEIKIELDEGGVDAHSEGRSKEALKQDVEVVKHEAAQGDDDVVQASHADDDISVMSAVETDYEEVPLIEIKKSIKKEHRLKKGKYLLNNKCRSNTIKADKKGEKLKKKKKSVATPERAEHRVNLTTILQNSNASPFRDKTAKGYTCLYCAIPFSTIEQLREHTSLDREKYKINQIKNHVLSYHPIKLDITDLKCTLCQTEMADLNDLKEHLVNTHNKTIHKHIKDIIIPFRLNEGDGLACVLCSVEYVSFKNLYHHMSTHFTNHYCAECGIGYITLGALKKHAKTHENGQFPCHFCDKVFPSEDKRKQHQKGVHNSRGWLRNKCPYCPKVFVGYYDKTTHLSEVHNEKPLLFPCNACNKVYKKKFDLNRHIKNHHLQQKSYVCTICGADFFSLRGMNDHMQRHDARIPVFSCDVCGKGFSRPRTLKEHLKSHEEGHRFECSICNKNFTQKSSLNSHRRLHQNNLEIFKEFDDVQHLVDTRDVTLKQIGLESKKKEEDEKAGKGMENPLQFFNLNL